MKQFIQFGEKAEGYPIPVLNEREIRAAAGILFLGTFISLGIIFASNNFVFVKYFSTFFLIDLLIRVLINPRYSPTLILGRWIVRNQTPEYVAAKQKKFAWTIGIVLASLMFVFLVIVNAYSIITGITCLVCLLFLFFEASFGICLGCMVYPLFFKDKTEYCPGEVCDKKARQPIQKIAAEQVVVLTLFIAAIIFIISISGDYYSRHPHNLFPKTTTIKNK
ncbi:MAG: DUF4395 domain-containing protein [Chitinophagaceae bacterium]